jgi:ribosome-associated protein
MGQSNLYTGPGIQLSGEAWIDRQQLVYEFSRSGGPGGQNVNKVNTKTELRVNPAFIYGLSNKARHRLMDLARNRLDAAGMIVMVSSDQRTQEANRRSCLDKLRKLVSESLIEPKVRRKTKPTAGSRRRRVEGKKLRSKVKAARRSSKSVSV